MCYKRNMCFEALSYTLTHKKKSKILHVWYASCTLYGSIILTTLSFAFRSNIFGYFNVYDNIIFLKIFLIALFIKKNYISFNYKYTIIFIRAFTCYLKENIQKRQKIFKRHRFQILGYIESQSAVLFKY